MVQLFEQLEGFSFVSVVFRLGMAAVFSGILGMDRENKQRPAGFRTYLLVCLGAAAAMILGEYEAAYFSGYQGRLDISRIGAQVINGIGFLGAGTVLVTNQQEVKGLTTASGLWASACMGLAIGAGDYVCAVTGFGIILLSFRMFPGIEKYFSSHSHHMLLYLEFHSLSDIHEIAAMFRDEDVEIYGVEILDKKESLMNGPAAIFTLYLNRKQSRSEIVLLLSDLDYIYHIDEI